MRSRAVAAVALATLAALAGCADDGPGGGTTPTATPTGTQSSSSTSTGPPLPPPPVLQLLAFDLVDCFGLSIQHTRPLEDIQALLPDGFTAAPPPGSSSEAAGAVGVDLYQCASLATATAAVPDTFVGLVYAYVERPAERVPTAPEVPVHEYVFRMLAGEDVLAQLWKAALYDTHNGSAFLEVVGPADAPARSMRGAVGDYGLAGSGAALGALAGGRDQAFARYTLIESDSSVLLWTGTYDLPAVAVGPGAMEVAADDPIAPLGTPERVFFAGTATQVDAGNVRGSVLSRVFT